MKTVFESIGEIWKRHDLLKREIGLRLWLSKEKHLPSVHQALCSKPPQHYIQPKAYPCNPSSPEAETEGPQL